MDKPDQNPNALPGSSRQQEFRNYINPNRYNRPPSLSLFDYYHSNSLNTERSHTNSVHGEGGRSHTNSVHGEGGRSHTNSVHGEGGPHHSNSAPRQVPSSRRRPRATTPRDFYDPNLDNNRSDRSQMPANNRWNGRTQNPDVRPPRVVKSRAEALKQLKEQEAARLIREEEAAQSQKATTSEHVPMIPQSSPSASDDIIIVDEIIRSNSSSRVTPNRNNSNISDKPSSSKNKSTVSSSHNNTQRDKQLHQQQASTPSSSSTKELPVIDITNSPAEERDKSPMIPRESTRKPANFDPFAYPPRRKPVCTTYEPYEYDRSELWSSNTGVPPPPPKPNIPANRDHNSIMKMSHAFGGKLVDRKRENKNYKKPDVPRSPPPWNPNDLLPEVVDDDGYDSCENIPLPPGPGPCGTVSTKQNLALEVSCIKRSLQYVDPEKRLQIIKSFVDEKTQCTIFFYIHAKEFENGNESMLARVAIQRFVLVLNNALKLYELSKMPDKFFGKNEPDPGKEWHIPEKNSYDYSAEKYVEFDRAGTSKRFAEIYTEFTQAETNILLDAHMIIQHSKELSPESRTEYIEYHAGQIFEWVRIIKFRAAMNEHIHPIFIVWCDFALPFKKASYILGLIEIFFNQQMTAISESLQKEFGDEKCTPLQHKRYYQAAIKGLKCNDFGFDNFHCRDDNLCYTAFVGSFFNDLCNINDGNEEEYQPYMDAFRRNIAKTNNLLQEEYGNFQNFFSDNQFWDKIIEGKCQSIPKPLDLCQDFAHFIRDASEQDPSAFDNHVAQLIRPLSDTLKGHMKSLATFNSDNTTMSKEERETFVQTVIDDIMAHFYPVLRTFNDLSCEHSAAVRLFTIFVLKGFLMEWEEYNKWTNEMREGKKYNREATGLDLQLIKEYFGKDFMSLPANVMTAIWERRFHYKFFSPNVPEEFRRLLTCPEYKILPAATITNILDFCENIDKNDIEVQYFKKATEESEKEEEDELMDTDEVVESIKEGDKDASTSIEMSVSMEVENAVSNKNDNNDNDPSIQAQEDSVEKQAANISKLGLKPPCKVVSGRLSHWAFNNALNDLEENGDGFLMAPINQPQENTLNKRKNEFSLNDYVSKITFNHPLLKANEKKLQKDFLHLLPELQIWALHFTSVLTSIASSLLQKTNDTTNQNGTTKTAVPESLIASPESLIASPSTQKDVLFNALNNPAQQLLSPTPLIAVCSENVSVIYPLPTPLLNSPKSENLLERHSLKSSQIWDYLQGKEVTFDIEVIAFLCDMWKRTAEYSLKRKPDGTLNNYNNALNVIRDIQCGKEFNLDFFTENVIGVRFPYDLRKQEYLKNFCTVYIDMAALNFKQFNFDFDIKIAPNHRVNIPYEIDESETEDKNF